MKLLALACCAALVACAAPRNDGGAAARRDAPPSAMDLGAFSVSLAVKDLAASREFYRKLAFEPAGGNPAQN